MKAPELTMPRAEAAYLRDAVARARVYVEYGSGGSTALAAQTPGLTIFSVESDAAWLANMALYFAEHPPKGVLHLHHGDIGPTKEWGHPQDQSHRHLWPLYAQSVWQRSDFQQPDTVLIDGRFRVSCFMAVAMRCTAPVTVLFDDYKSRGTYHVVEQLIKPTQMIGRMACFHVLPNLSVEPHRAWIDQAAENPA